tara:strand:- start:123 stop:386 length:264 start_codon:yes stop_codon:yes gene_type:complete
MGCNKYDYINDDYSNMIEGNILPWTQDVPETNIWGNWDVTIRDVYILDRDGNLFAVMNLTNNNPDPNSNCGENYQTLKNLILAARNQ